MRKSLSCFLLGLLALFKATHILASVGIMDDRVHSTYIASNKWDNYSGGRRRLALSKGPSVMFPIPHPDPQPDPAPKT